LAIAQETSPTLGFAKDGAPVGCGDLTYVRLCRAPRLKPRLSATTFRGLKARAIPEILLAGLLRGEFAN
jgi:hypothetical protein